jgi:hypothetical protein
MPLVFARRLRGLLFLPLFLGLVLLLPLKMRMSCDESLDMPIFTACHRPSCLSIPARLGSPEEPELSARGISCGVPLWMTCLDDSRISRLSSSKLLYGNRAYTCVYPLGVTCRRGLPMPKASSAAGASAPLPGGWDRLEPCLEGQKPYPIHRHQTMS